MERYEPDDLTRAARKLEEAEDILSAADGLDNFRERVTEVRSELVNHALREIDWAAPSDIPEPGLDCIQCGETVSGDIMIPEGADGAVHPDCFNEWMEDNA